MIERSIFQEALDRHDQAERAAYLDKTCAGDAELRRRVEGLLQAHKESAYLLEPFDIAGATAQLGDEGPDPWPALDPIIEGPGSRIGPYRLLQQIGEGGMAVVYMAEQERPIRRNVALKIIKPGVDTGQVLLRFEAERQALARIDHVNFARVLDAGTTSTGRPFFVMDLIKGAPITKYCDDHRLTLRERLELFIPVCQAVQHAHQKGIIHRDLKPSNVLVAQYDGRPVPKVIDFGVAKAAGQQLTDKTLMTGFSSLIGTLEYMSPEQAEINQLDIDTRSDIYSLGVVLYELLTGSTPLDRNRLTRAAFTEILRIIREEEPQKPSTRLSDSTDSLPSISAQRHMKPAKLTRSVRGELDWIVMKALEKDRYRRYETANDFAIDIQRYLADEVVQACPPSAWYRLRKFVPKFRTGRSVAMMWNSQRARWPWRALTGDRLPSAEDAEADERSGRIERLDDPSRKGSFFPAKGVSAIEEKENLERTPTAQISSRGSPVNVHREQAVRPLEQISPAPVTEEPDERMVNVWLDGAKERLRVGKTYRVGIDVDESRTEFLSGQPMSALEWNEKNEIGLTLVLSGDEIRVSPPVRQVTLRRRDGLKEVFFDVILLRSGEPTFFVSIFLTRELVLVQKIRIILHNVFEEALLVEP
jgi:serine/threonine protein kinase